MYKLILLALFGVLFSCKKKSEIPNFELTADRVVTLKVNAGVKKALNVLAIYEF